MNTKLRSALVKLENELSDQKEVGAHKRQTDVLNADRHDNDEDIERLKSNTRTRIGFADKKEFEDVVFKTGPPREDERKIEDTYVPISSWCQLHDNAHKRGGFEAIPRSRHVEASSFRASLRKKLYNTRGGQLARPNGEPSGNSMSQNNRRGFVKSAGWKKVKRIDFKIEEARKDNALRHQAAKENSRRVHEPSPETRREDRDRFVLKFRKISNLTMRLRAAQDLGSFRAVSGCIDNFEFQDKKDPKGKEPFRVQFKLPRRDCEMGTGKKIKNIISTDLVNE